MIPYTGSSLRGDGLVSMNTHPLAQIIPPLTTDEIARLEESLKQGYDSMKPIVTLDGMILDGRHRAEIAARLGVEPTYAAWVPAWDGDTPAGFVARSIIHRSLSASQRATIAAELLPHLEANANAGGRPPKQLGEKVRQVSRAPRSSAIAAKATGTNEKYVEVASKVKEVDPATFEKMKAGTVSMAEAKKVVAPRKAPPPRSSTPAVPPEAQVALDAIPEFKALVNAIRAAKKEGERLANKPGGEELATRWRSIESHLHNAAEMVKFSAPYVVCPYMPNCEVGCKTCKKRKWIDRTIFDALPVAIKESVKVGA